MSATGPSATPRCSEPAQFRAEQPIANQIDVVREMLRDGGLSVETSDENGKIALRTVFQLDGDVIFWIAEDFAQDPAPGSDLLMERHWEKVVGRTTELEAALLGLEGDADKGIRAIRLLGKGGTISGFLSSAVSFIQATAPVTRVASVLLMLFGIAFWRWGPRLIARYVLRYVKNWVGVPSA